MEGKSGKIAVARDSRAAPVKGAVMPASREAILTNGKASGEMTWYGESLHPPPEGGQSRGEPGKSDLPKAVVTHAKASADSPSWLKGRANPIR